MAGNVDYASSDMIVLPGGRVGTEKLRMSEIVRMQCGLFSSVGEFLAAICAAPSILAELGLLEGKEATATWITKDFHYRNTDSLLSGMVISICRTGDVI